MAWKLPLLQKQVVRQRQIDLVLVEMVIGEMNGAAPTGFETRDSNSVTVCMKVKRIQT